MTFYIPAWFVWLAVGIAVVWLVFILVVVFVLSPDKESKKGI